MAIFFLLLHLLLIVFIERLVSIQIPILHILCLLLVPWKNMVWNCIRIISFAVFIISCSNKKNSNYIDTLTVNEVISNWKNSIKEKGEPPYLGGMYVENGIVYFCITNDTYNIRNDIFERCKSSNGVIIKMCGNSKESLMQQIKILDSLLIEKDFTKLKYYGHYLRM